MTLKNMISIFALLVVVLMLLPSVCGYTFGGRGALHDMETSDYVLHPEKDKVVTLEDLRKVETIQTHTPSFNIGIITGTLLSPEEEMLFPEEKPINMHDFAGHGSIFGTPLTGLQDIGPHLGDIGPHLGDIGPHLDLDIVGGWGEPTSIGACGHFYGLGVI